MAAMGFIYRPLDSIDKASLSQGDVIRRTAELADAISQAHKYYGTARDYTHFVVMTQSCDLVRRQGRINAPYVTLAAARPANLFVRRQIDPLLSEVDNVDLKILKSSALKKIERLLERIIHNTEDDIFFLPADGCDALSEDLCVFLHLSIALRVDHYEKILAGKIAELEDIFRAKLGWLKGNIYSRVATPDVEEHVQDHKEYKKGFFDRYVPDDRYLQLSSLQLSYLKNMIKDRSPEIGVDSSIIDEIPTDADIVAQSLLKTLENKKFLADDVDRGRVKKALMNNSHLKTVLQQIS